MSMGTASAKIWARCSIWLASLALIADGRFPFSNTGFVHDQFRMARAINDRWANVCMHVCMQACMYVCMYVYMYVCMLAAETAKPLQFAFAGLRSFRIWYYFGCFLFDIYTLEVCVPGGCPSPVSSPVTSFGLIIRAL